MQLHDPVIGTLGFSVKMLFGMHPSGLSFLLDDCYPSLVSSYVIYALKE